MRKIKEPPPRLDVIRAMQRPPDLTFTVELWHLHDGTWWHEPYTIISNIGKPSPAALRVLGHAVFDDGQLVWNEAGSPRPKRRKIVKARRGRR